MSLFRRAFFLTLILVCLASCSLNNSYVRIRVEAPSVPSVKMSDYREIAVADFFVPEPAPGLNLNRELTDYLKTELGFRFKGNISRRSLPLDKEDNLTDEAFWKEAAAGASGLLFLTGKASLEEELRKALLNKGSQGLEEPFTKEKAWAERKNFTLQVTLILIDGGTGSPVFKKEYKETINYTNIKQPPAFALFDLLQQLKLKFLRSVFGTDRPQERYIIFR
jgi:hypothetical protein